MLSQSVGLNGPTPYIAWDSIGPAGNFRCDNGKNKTNHIFILFGAIT